MGSEMCIRDRNQLGLKDNTELICAGKTARVVRDRTSYLGWVQFEFDKKLFLTMSACETAMRGKPSGGSMESFRIKFSQDGKTFAISVAKLRAGLLNSYINESLKTFDIVKLSKEKSETKVIGEKTRQNLKTTTEALKKSEETKVAALRKVAEQQKYIEEMEAKLAALSK